MMSLTAGVMLAGLSMAPGRASSLEPGDGPLRDLVAAAGGQAAVIDLSAGGAAAAPVVLHFPCTSGGAHPALAIVGGLGAQHAAGSELVQQITRRLADGADPLAQAVLSRCSVYAIGVPSPPARSSGGELTPLSATPTDDDRDGRLDEDGPDDLDGDGYITMLRIKDRAGKWRVHPLDPRVLIPVRPELNEQGEYSVHTEGIDNDGDGRFNEDGPGGVDFNQSWTWNYPENKPGAGPFPMSEPEARAVADFLYEHPEIAVVYALGPQDNLAFPWQAGNDGGRIKTGVLAGDAPVLKYLSEQYKKSVDTAAAPKGAPGDGSFGYWAYFHYGRWSLMAQPWWVPAPPKKEEPKPDAGAPADPARPAWDEKDERGKDELRQLQWLAEQGHDAFAPWTAVEHPDFPGQQVEVGGLRAAALAALAPLDGLAEKHLAFLGSVAGLLPRLSIDNVKTTALGAGVWRIEARVVNSGFLPSFSEMGELGETHQRLQATLGLPAGATLLKGRQRESIPRLEGGGGSRELSWLVSGLSQGAALQLEVSAPAVGAAMQTITVGGAP